MRNYTKQKTLGSGKFGTVYRFKDITKTPGEQDEIIAIKRIPLVKQPAVVSSAKPARRVPNPLLEVETQKRLNHPHVVRLLKAFQSEEHNELYLVLEYCDGGDLRDFIKDRGPLPLPLVQRFTAEIVSALLHLQNNHMFHRDLKAENLLLTSKNPATTEIKVSDFGFAKTIAEDVDPMRLVQTTCGTPMYMAPERCNAEPYSYPSDVWSVGLVICEMAFGKHLFHKCKTHPDLFAAHKNVASLVREAFDELGDANIREALEPMVLGMLTIRPSDRWSLTLLCRSCSWLRCLLHANGDLQALALQEGMGTEWLDEAHQEFAKLGAQPVATKTWGDSIGELLRSSPKKVAEQPRVANVAADNDHDDDGFEKNTCTEVAKSVDPPAHAGRVVAANVISWCVATMNWVLQPLRK